MAVELFRFDLHMPFINFGLSADSYYKTCVSQENRMFHYQRNKERVSKTFKPAPPSAKHSRAIRHIENGLAPANPAVLKFIKDQLQAENYNGEEFLNDLCQDPGCLVQCLREIPSHVENAEAGVNPFSSIASLDKQTIDSIIAKICKNSESSRFESISLSQGKELQFLVASTLSAKAVSSGCSEMNPEHCAVGMAFRYLGRYLVAWNYPRTFAQIQKSHQRQGIPIDVLVKEQIGIAPLEIMQHIAGKWNFDGELREFCKSLPNSLSPDSSSLDAILFISELYAQSRDVESYPQSESTWAEYSETIEVFLPESAKSTLDDNFEIAIQTLSKISKTPIRLPFLLQKKKAEQERREQEAERVEYPNEYIEFLPVEIRKLFLKVYEELGSHSLPVNALRFLVEETIPACGFARGCIYLLDEKKYSLKPSLRIGQIGLKEYGKLVDQQIISINDCLTSTIPLISHTSNLRSVQEECLVIIGALQNSEHPGVLYLEADHVQTAAEHSNKLFHCIRVTVNDCFDKVEKSK